MTANEREQLRLSLLRYLGENPTRFGYNLTLLLQMARNEGHAATKEIIAAEVQYLEDKGLVLLVAKILSPENRAWRITAAGRDQLAANE